MSDRRDVDDALRDLTLALRDEEGDPTPSCPDTLDMMDLLEQGAEHPQAEPTLRHIVGCAYCRPAFAEVRQTMQLAAEVAALVSKAAPPVHVGAPTRAPLWDDLLSPPRYAAAVVHGLQALPSYVYRQLQQPLAAIQGATTSPAFALARGGSAEEGQEEPSAEEIAALDARLRVGEPLSREGRELRLRATDEALIVESLRQGGETVADFRVRLLDGDEEIFAASSQNASVSLPLDRLAQALGEGANRLVIESRNVEA